jgi:hypothetical protein
MTHCVTESIAETSIKKKQFKSFDLIGLPFPRNNSPVGQGRGNKQGL